VLATDVCGAFGGGADGFGVTALVGDDLVGAEFEITGVSGAESGIAGISGSGSGVNTKSVGVGTVALGAASMTVSFSDPLETVACISEMAAITVAPTIPVAAATEAIVLFLFMTQPCQNEH